MSRKDFGMYNKRRNKLSILLSIMFIIILSITVRFLIQYFMKDISNNFLSGLVDVLLVIFFSSPFLFIMQSQQKQIIRNEEKYRSLVEHNSALICEFNLDGYLVNANSILTQATGYEVEDVLYLPIQALVVEEEVEKAEEYFDRAKRGELLNFELTVYHKSRQKIQLGIKSVPIFLENQITGLFFIAKDITERKKDFEQLKFIKHQLESFVSNCSEAICLFHKDGNIIHVNQAYEQLFGWDKEELEGCVFPEVPANLLEKMSEIYDRVLKGEQVKNFETIRKRKDGTMIYVSLSFSTILNEKEEVMALAVIARDITKRKEMEKALSESKEKYQLIAENMSDYITLIDTVGKIRYLSESHKNLAAFDKETLSISMIHPEDQRKAIRLFQHVRDSKIQQSAEVRVQNKQGDWVTVETTLKPIINTEGKLDGFMIVSKDVTERKKAEEILLRSEKLSVAGQLAAGVAHEIRNPLTTLRGFVQLMLGSPLNHDKYLPIMLSELDRINLIVSEFLILSKPHLRHFAVKEIHSVLYDVITLLEPQAALTNITFEFDIHCGNASVECEENHLKQVFINLLKNSMEAMPNGGHIAIQAEVEDDQVVLKFEDEGSGISPDVISKLGEPFFTTKENGTGLGMMISFKIIEDHNGKMMIKSDEGKGTTVKIYLPLYLSPVIHS